ncbi:hypothetical protein CO046_03305 [Candidatus Peregrinibacteria bacterium CG_4_9_14_0_2_um_filter_53_11]|nr:MAG: hypothetical protein CO046_03305 [Candidatus Peregrinibacteria bacterium CG_4_9_14_0_2_um_filter_53_11]
MLSTVIGVVLLALIVVVPTFLFVKLALSVVKKQMAPLLERFGTSEELPSGKVLLQYFDTKAAAYKHKVWMAVDSSHIFFEIPKIGTIKLDFGDFTHEVKDLQGNESFLFFTLNLTSLEGSDLKIKDIHFSFRKSDLPMFPQIAKMAGASE